MPVTRSTPAAHLFKLMIVFIITFPYSLTADEAITQKDFDCVIIPSNVADLGSNTRGVINQIVVDRNDFIKGGDVIAVLDNEVEQVTVELASKQAETISEIELCKVNLAYAQREQKRAEEAYNEKAYSLHHFDLTKVETELAKIKLLQAQEKQILSNNELKRAKARLAHKTIRAPFSGVVMERFKVIGEYIDDEAVIRLAQLDPLHVEVIVPVLERGNIKVGMHAKVCSDLKENGWDATVSQVDQVMDAASGTFGVRLTLANPDHKIPAGLRCDLKFVSPATHHASNTIEERVTSSHE